MSTIKEGKDQWSNTTAPVGSFKPNGYGSFDMSGHAYEWCADWLDSLKSNYILKDYLKTDVRFWIQDVRQQLPNGNFDLILCRNLIFTYFQQDLQSKLLEQIVEKLKLSVFLFLVLMSR